MIIFPAVDIRCGKCVRLVRGLVENETVYGSPVEMAMKWAAAGAKWLHIVDLDAAFTGEAKNLGVIEEIIRSAPVSVQLGGGIRTLADIKKRLEAGVSRVVLGTMAVKAPGAVREAAARWPGKIAVGIDAKNGKVAIRGWTEESACAPLEFAQSVKRLGVDTVIYTDISRDGTLLGPNVEETLGIAATGLKVIASGGIGGIDDLKRLKRTGIYGAIIGKALYDGAVDIVEAVALQD